MAKCSKFSSSSPVLGQLLSFIPRDIVKQNVLKLEADKGYSKVKTWDQLVFMLFAVLTGSSGLRAVINHFELMEDKLHHIGLSRIPKRSSMSDANSKRNSDVFRSIYMNLYLHYKEILSDSYLSCLINGEIDPAKVEIFDSTTVTLFKDIFKGCGRLPKNGQRKGGIKAFSKITLSERVPNLVVLKDACTNERVFLDSLNFMAGTITVFDKGFHKFGKYHEWDQSNVFYVTCMNNNSSFKILKRLPLKEVEEDGVQEDCLIELNYQCKESGGTKTIEARMVAYIDPVSKRRLVFLTNLRDVSPLTISLLYKNRWVIEPLFKQIKQNFELNHFLSDSEEGIKTQLWIAMILNLIFTVIHKLIKEAEDFSTILDLASKNTAVYINYITFLKRERNYSNSPICKDENLENMQLQLFTTNKIDP